MNDFAVFILSHGRADRVTTVKMLEEGNYSGEWFIVIDDEDDQEHIYREKYGDHVIQFCKREIADRTDTADLDDDRRVGVFARNFIIEEAKRRGYAYHLQCDDDFHDIRYRYVVGNKLVSKKCTHFDELFKMMREFLETTDTVWISFGVYAQYFGGIKSKNFHDGLYRGTMCSFFIKTDAAPWFICRMNDDITTCCYNVHRGKLMFSVMPLQLSMEGTQAADGGMTEIYNDNGTYRKSFYTIICCPSFSIINDMGRVDKRLHHQISWNKCAPCILNERWKKRA